MLREMSEIDLMRALVALTQLEAQEPASIPLLLAVEDFARLTHAIRPHAGSRFELQNCPN